MKIDNKTIIIIAGGTGGHVYPALALAQALAAEGAKIRWIGSENSFESKLVQQFPFHALNMRGVRGNGIWRWLILPYTLTRALLQARKILRAHDVALAIGMGGFVTAPAGLAAWSCAIPLLIHEQNARAGLANKLLSHIARRILLGEALAKEDFARRVSSKITFTGNPLRQQFTNVAAPSVRFAARRGKITMLVLGGSQGAKALNTIIPAALALLNGDDLPQVIHQCGAKWLTTTTEHYRQLGIAATVIPFIDDMATAYADCDFLIARSGALTVAEVASVGVAAIFIPFPFAVDDHQRANASALSSSGAAVIIDEKNLTAATLAKQISAFCSRRKLLAMAQAANAHSHSAATAKIIALIKQL